MEKILTVTEDQVIVPTNLTPGTYKLVPIKVLEEGKKNYAIRIDELKEYFRFYNLANENSATFTHLLKTLLSSGYEFLEELEGIEVDELRRNRSIGKGCISILIIICKELGVEIIYDAKMYQTDIKRWEGSYKKLK